MTTSIFENINISFEILRFQRCPQFRHRLKNNTNLVREPNKRRFFMSLALGPNNMLESIKHMPKILPKSLTRGPKGSPRAPKKLPESSGERPRSPSELPTWPPKRPRGVQGVLRSSSDRTRSAVAPLGGCSGCAYGPLFSSLCSRSTSKIEKERLEYRRRAADS